MRVLSALLVLVGLVPATLHAAPAATYTSTDTATELARSYFGARYYSAKRARFTTVDPVYTVGENLVDPQRWNRYAYVRNNPLRYTDPDGRCIDACVLEGYAVYMVGAAAVATTAWLVSPAGQQAVSQVVNDTRTMITTAVRPIRKQVRPER